MLVACIQLKYQQLTVQFIFWHPENFQLQNMRNNKYIIGNYERSYLQPNNLIPRIHSPNLAQQSHVIHDDVDVLSHNSYSNSRSFGPTAAQSLRSAINPLPADDINRLTWEAVMTKTPNTRPKIEGWKPWPDPIACSTEIMLLQGKFTEKGAQTHLDLLQSYKDAGINLLEYDIPKTVGGIKQFDIKIPKLPFS